MYLLLLALIAFTFLLEIKYKNEKITTNFSNYLLVFFAVLSGIRYDVGIDYLNYQDSFYYSSNYSIEIIYLILEQSVKFLFNDFVVLTMVMSILTSLFIYLALNSRKIIGFDRLIAVCFFIFFLGIPSFNLMRQGLSIAIIYYATSFLHKNNRKYGLYVLLAMGFHFSSIIFLGLIFFKNISKISIGIKGYLLLGVIACITNFLGVFKYFFSLVISLVPRYGVYSDFILKSDNHSIIHMRDLLIFMLISGLLILNGSYHDKIISFLEKKRLIQDNNVNVPILRNKHIENMDILFFQLGSILNILVATSFIFNRISIMFLPFGCSGLIFLYNRISNSILKENVKCLVWLVLMILLINELLITSEQGHIVYRTVFFR